MDAKSNPVAVIGAGPVGLFTALLLAQQGIKVIVHETGPGISQSPRAVAYFPAVLEEFSKAGILDAVIAAGEKNQDGCDWRNKNGDIIAGIDPPPGNPYYAVMLSQPEFCQVVLDALIQTGNAEINFRHTLRGFQQRDGLVEYDVENEAASQPLRYKCRYLVGADGGRSTVRQNLGIQLEGYTWESMLFVAVNFEYGLSELGWKAANFIVDPDDWGVVVKRGKGNSWRLATGILCPGAPTVKVNKLNEATINIVKDRLSRFLPGDTSRIEYQAIAPYVVHQRCASSFVQGNILLAGDAAHLNNPVGGLGLTTGILDAAHLAGSLRQVLKNGAPVELLTSYSETRRRVFRQTTNPITTANLRRLWSTTPEDVKERETFFEKLRDPKDVATPLQVGLVDFSLTSTSHTKFDTYHEVTWFISVTKRQDWDMDTFRHEYRTVHANMTRKGKEHGSPLRQYVQLSNNAQTMTMKGGVRADWDYVSCLTFPNLFLVHAGFQDPGYRATAGSHIFCRLDQQGCLTQEVARLRNDTGRTNDDGHRARALLFHERSSPTDEYSQEWLEARVDGLSGIVRAEMSITEYVLWRDITPRNLDYFFRETQFSAGSWHRYKAVEAFDFVDEDSVAAFLDRHGEVLASDRTGRITVVAGVPDNIL
ncbi:uncharacterized protein DSM5745_06148 [Aspergillus mulundensis]|uniref:Uncharacterized protein n=1 Tax=Aspergillus mulundensis TaxID=1810919 RepID=A0A3D8RZ34_9EURO|nr:Uncharacterized protein DSM5745_06148 [Aspergillus mulundensis]RDW79296.1 Uncharacterized protein DSM5745_06148 [Aspergillus mulundensis]